MFKPSGPARPMIFFFHPRFGPRPTDGLAKTPGYYSYRRVCTGMIPGTALILVSVRIQMWTLPVRVRVLEVSNQTPGAEELPANIYEDQFCVYE